MTAPLPIADTIPRDLLLPLKGKRVAILGASGFVGWWLLESLLATGVGAEVCIWCRSMLDVSPYFGRVDETHSGLLVMGGKPFDYVLDCTKDGIACAYACSIVAPGGRMLYLSSGAVYGVWPRILGPVAEDDGWEGAIDDYGRMKQRHELLCQDRAVIARLFSFIGPGLRRHTGKEFLEADPIRVKDDGAVRSYMWAGDMARILWTILLRGQVGRVYNVGSPEPMRVVDFARRCADIRGVPLEIEPGTGGTYYVPNTDRARDELGLTVTVGVDEAIRRTLEWMAKS